MDIRSYTFSPTAANVSVTSSEIWSSDILEFSYLNSSERRVRINIKTHKNSSAEIKVIENHKDSFLQKETNIFAHS